MPSTTENVKLGVCSAIFDGVNLGLTKGGVEIEVSTSTHEVQVDQYGQTPIGELIQGRTVTATVPMAETTLDNLARIMPGAVFETDGVAATGTVTFSTGAPVAGDHITVNGTRFTFRAAPSVEGDVKIGAGTGGAALAPTAANFAAAINASDVGLIATAAGAVVTLRAKATGTAWNGAVTAVFATPANVTATALSGGTNGTYARVRVGTGVNINLLTIAKELILRPKNTFGEDDFVILRAATPGALNFTFSVENERVYQVQFKGYVAGTGDLFRVGHP